MVICMTLLPLDADQLLSTTRAVRKRLDTSRDVPNELITQCAAIAMQAPSGSNQLTMQFVVIKDQAKRTAIADIYADCWQAYQSSPVFAGSIKRADSDHQAQQDRVTDSATYLSEHMAEIPVLVLACTGIRSRKDAPLVANAGVMGNILPATWSFMLAARARGLGTAWTTIHLMQEERVANLLGIPFETVAQVCLFPLAYTLGTDFKPATRPDPSTIIHHDGW